MPILDLDADARVLARTLDVVVPDSLRAATLGTWLGRMVNEHGSAQVFDGLASQLEAAAWDPVEVAECHSFAAEERRHGVMCGAVVVAAGGRAWAKVPAPQTFPEHADVSRLEAAARNVLAISCMAETVAVALIGAEQKGMKEGTLRDLLTQIWADEVGHARFGWRILPAIVARLTPGERARLGAYMAVAFAHTERHELAHLPLTAVKQDGGEALGLCSGHEARVLFYRTVAEAIVPALEQVGLPAKAAWDARPRAKLAA